jgi:hypothetical protein
MHIISTNKVFDYNLINICQLVSSVDTLWITGAKPFATFKCDLDLELEFCNVTACRVIIIFTWKHYEPIIEEVRKLTQT